MNCLEEPATEAQSFPDVTKAGNAYARPANQQASLHEVDVEATCFCRFHGGRAKRKILPGGLALYCSRSWLTDFRV